MNSVDLVLAQINWARSQRRFEYKSTQLPVRMAINIAPASSLVRPVAVRKVTATLSRGY